MNEFIEMPETAEKQWSKTEKLILPAALMIGILFDRLILKNFTTTRIQPNYSLFWLGYLIIFYAVYWKRLKNDIVLWFVSACTTALIVWSVVFSFFKVNNYEYAFITALVIPSVLMAHAQWAARKLSWKDFDGAVIGMAVAWFEGWLIKPLTGLGELFGVSASFFTMKNKSVFIRAALGLLITFFMMVILIPLLMGADQMFNYFMLEISARLNLTSVFFHTSMILIVFGLFYSFIWNVGFGENEFVTIDATKKIDRIISTIILGSVVLVYLLFCGIQFTYLFARMGLPNHLTYSQYARSGFSQTVTVCAINLLIFGFFLWRGKRGKLLSALLFSLLALTGTMLVSGAIRLFLYIDAYRMTWLRLISAWFIIYLAVVIILCVARLFAKRKFPVAGISALLLLVWYIALGYLNPDRFIEWYNYENTLRSGIEFLLN